jgi:hypothetical protein
LALRNNKEPLKEIKQAADSPDEKEDSSELEE